MIVCAVNDHKIVEEQVATAVENQTSPRAAFMDITNKFLRCIRPMLVSPSSPRWNPLPGRCQGWSRMTFTLHQSKRPAREQRLVSENFMMTSDNLHFLIMDQTMPRTGAKIWVSPHFLVLMWWQEVWIFLVMAHLSLGGGCRLQKRVSVPCAFYLWPGKDANQVSTLSSASSAVTL